MAPLRSKWDKCSKWDGIVPHQPNSIFLNPRLPGIFVQPLPIRLRPKKTPKTSASALGESRGPLFFELAAMSLSRTVRSLQSTPGEPTFQLLSRESPTVHSQNPKNLQKNSQAFGLPLASDLFLASATARVLPLENWRGFSWVEPAKT